MSVSLPITQPQPAPTLSARGLMELNVFLDFLDSLELGLTAAAHAYVTTGAPADAPGRMAKHLEMRPLALDPSKPRRLCLSFLLYAGECDLAPLKRLGQLLMLIAKAQGYVWLRQGSAALDFFRGLIWVIEAWVPSAPSATRWVLSGPSSLALLQTEGANEQDLVELLFTPFQGPVGKPQRVKHLLTMKGLPEVLRAAPARVLAGAHNTAGASRGACLRLLHEAGFSGEPGFHELLLETMDRSRQEAGAAFELLLRNPQARALLERRLPLEKSARMRRQIEQQLQLQAAALAEAPSDKGYAALTGEWIVIPPAAAPGADTPVPAELKEALSALLLKTREACQQDFEEARRIHGPQRTLNGGKSYAPEEAAGCVEVMNGVVPPNKAAGLVPYLAGLQHPPANQRRAVMLHQHWLRELLCHPGITLHHLARLFAVRFSGTPGALLALLSGVEAPVSAQLLREAAFKAGDLRPVLADCAPYGAGARVLLREYLGAPYFPLSQGCAPPLWQVVAENMDLIDEALDKRSKGRHNPRILPALELLAQLPATPARYLDRLMRLALEADAQEGVRARALLKDTPRLEAHLHGLLTHAQQRQRILGARWLAELGNREAAPALHAALQREKVEGARRALLQALAVLGEDIRPHLTHPAALDEARHTVLERAEEVEACLPLAQLPALRWADGQPVPPELVGQWVLEAHAAKNPRGGPLLHLLLARLHPQDAEQFGLLALTAYIRHDTYRLSEEEILAFAEARADSTLTTYQRWGRSSITREQVVKEIADRKRREYPNNALGHRGLLAFIRHSPPRETVRQVRAYLHDHSRRIHQCAAVLDALAEHPSPLVLQFLEEVALRHRKKATRRRTEGLLRTRAWELGCSREDLADRSVSTGGLDERGTLALQSSSGPVTAQLNAQLRVVLKDPQGRKVPALRVAEDVAGIGSRRDLAELRREIPLIVEEQTRRLKKSMEDARVWTLEHFRLYLLPHPVLGPLCRLVIFAGVDAQGRMLGSFRVREDGSFTNATDDPVQIDAFAGIRVAHEGLLKSEEIAAWREHLDDYRLVLLLPQLG